MTLHCVSASCFRRDHRSKKEGARRETGGSSGVGGDERGGRRGKGGGKGGGGGDGEDRRGRVEKVEGEGVGGGVLRLAGILGLVTDEGISWGLWNNDLRAVSTLGH